MASTPDSLDAALAQVGDRWSLRLIDALLGGPRRFNELQQDLDGIATNVLSHRLKQLEGAGVLVARPYSGRPPRYTYELTETGRELGGALVLLAQWGARHGEGGDAPHHEACGTSLEPRWFCPTCERVVSDDEGDGLHYA
ncbi:MAG: helix-turn-helix transcriptional regulator [Actinobacteria bacterium]|nr:helix-turn-helix transcriptional regulator [Actinomycetota bacterium]